MNLNFKNKIVLVTGSSSGLGFFIARSFLQHGAKVVINGRKDINLKRALKNIKSKNAFSIKADVSNVSEAYDLIKQINQKFGKLDLVVCNVGSGKSVSPGDETYEEWQRIFSINLWSTTNIVEASKNMLSISKGSIICISSICGQEVILNAPITYSVAKAALNAYVKGISRPLGKIGIRINAISPGNILFKGSVWEEKIEKNPDMVEDMISNQVPLGRFGTAKEIADLSLWLGSSYTSFCTGSIYTIDGGQTRSL